MILKEVDHVENIFHVDCSTVVIEEQREFPWVAVYCLLAGRKVKRWHDIYDAERSMRQDHLDSLE